MTESYNIIISSLNELGVQLVNVLPKIIVTLIIWWVGNNLINLGGKLIKKIDISKTKIEKGIINTFSSIILVVGKIFLVLVVLDYWSIGKPIISALANGLTFTLAIALGLSFGKALEPEAKNIVESFKNKLGNK